jgi:hypothetical protein
MSASLAYYDSYRSARLPANLLQAQRDFFGAHTYERTDRPAGQWFHTAWPEVIAVAVIDRLVLRAAVAAHGHPAGVHQHPALVGLVADDGGEHAQRDLIGSAHAQAPASPGRGRRRRRRAPRSRRPANACRQRRRRAAHADFWAGQAGGAQPLGGPHAAAALLFGHRAAGPRAAAFVAGAGVGHHAAQRGAAFVQRAADLQRAHHSGGMPARWPSVSTSIITAKRWLVGRPCATTACAAASESTTTVSRSRVRATPHGFQLAGCNAHGVEDVAQTGVEEDLGFLQRGHRDAAAPAARWRSATAGTWPSSHAGAAARPASAGAAACAGCCAAGALRRSARRGWQVVVSACPHASGGAARPH